MIHLWYEVFDIYLYHCCCASVLADCALEIAVAKVGMFFSEGILNLIDVACGGFKGGNVVFVGGGLLKGVACCCICGLICKDRDGEDPEEVDVECAS